MEILSTGFFPYYQLQFDRHKKAIGAEILMRPIFGETEDKIKVLTSANQVYDLDVSAFKHALAWRNKYNLKCSSNFSGKSIARAEVIKEICILDCMGQTKIEITESDKLSREAIANLQFLSDTGFNISLDDYGSDHNGLNRAISLPLTEIKLDRFLVSRLPTPKAEIAIAYTIKMAQAMGMIFVAEGVETEQQFDILAKLGCDRFQGYLLHRPVEFLCEAQSLVAA